MSDGKISDGLGPISIPSDHYIINPNPTIAKVQAPFYIAFNLVSHGFLSSML